jgi:transcriptional regulator with GAF, ATPase, and Fis domain
MTVVSMPSSRGHLEAEAEKVAKLAITLSGRFSRMSADEIARAIEQTLDELGSTLYAGTCRLVEFSTDGSVAHVYAPLGAGQDDLSALDGWMIGRLTRGELVAVSRPDDLGVDAIALRERARRTGACCLLGVPASAADRVVCALAIDSTRAPRRWAAPLIERLTLLTEILGAALERRQHLLARHAGAGAFGELNARPVADREPLRDERTRAHDVGSVVGESGALRLALARLFRVAPTHSTVLLLGETGTGKELFARALHERSRRHARPLVRVNCAALPPALIESELFGHEKGAFTGAISARQGRFELADGGTIFLDEIGDLPQDVQVRFLRVLQEGEFERVGSSRTRRVNVRVVAATHRDLEASVAAGTFRADLYYRLSVYPIRLPPLRERREDVPQLVWHFIQRFQRELERHVTKVPQSVMDALQARAWPGNVRELENVIERAMIATAGGTLQLDEPAVEGPASPPAGAENPPAGTENLDEVQRRHIEGVLRRCGWRINGAGNAAERLGIHPNSLRYRMRKLGVMRVPRDRSGRESQVLGRASSSLS